MDTNMGYKTGPVPPTNEAGNPMPLTGYTSQWPEEFYVGYRFEDLIQKFGYRIQDAIRTPIYVGENGLDHQTMKNKTKWWKFWNRDLREAYKWYTGKVYIIFNQELHRYEFHKLLPQPSDEFIKEWNDSYYPTQTTPPSEDPTLAPEHHENSAVKKKRKPYKKRIHEHTFELDGGPCLKCGKTVSEMFDEDIKNYNAKKKVKLKETLIMDHIKKL